MNCGKGSALEKVKKVDGGSKWKGKCADGERERERGREGWG